MTLLLWLAPSAVIVFALVWRSLRRDAEAELSGKCLCHYAVKGFHEHRQHDPRCGVVR